MLELEPPEHTRLRTLVNRAFVSRQVERLAPAHRAAGERAASTASSRGASDLLAGLRNAHPRRA